MSETPVIAQAVCYCGKPAVTKPDGMPLKKDGAFCCARCLKIERSYYHKTPPRKRKQHERTI
jgi:hypothetical protein